MTEDIDLRIHDELEHIVHERDDDLLFIDQSKKTKPSITVYLDRGEFLSGNFISENSETITMKKHINNKIVTINKMFVTYVEYE